MADNKATSKAQEFKALSKKDQQRKIGDLILNNAMYIIIELMGEYVETERTTSDGRIDLVLQTDKFIYVIEFKLDGTAEEALQQINEKRYALPFETDSRQLFKIGVNFSNKTRNIDKWLVEGSDHA